MTLKQQAQEILRIAEKYGVEQNYLFLTTFERYQVQLKTLQTLKSKIKDEETIVTKEYVKGRGNVYIHPAVKEYNATTDSANRTVQTLMKIIRQMRDGKGEDGEDGGDPLLRVLRGERID